MSRLSTGAYISVVESVPEYPAYAEKSSAPPSLQGNIPDPQSFAVPSEYLNQPPEHAPQELSTCTTVIASEANEHETKHCSYSKSPHEVV